MKVKNFEKYLESRLNKKEISELKHQAKIEFDKLKDLQTTNEAYTMNYIFRQAKIEDADKLTELTLLSKASWGYPHEWMDAWRDELTITPGIIKNSISIIAKYNNEIVGFWCRPKVNSEEPTFGFLFIHPEHMGKGLAKALWKELSKKLIQNGIRTFTIIADPNAMPFYLKLGAVQIGMQDSKIIPGRKIPILKFTLNTDSKT